MAHCKILATTLDMYTMRCPTTPTKFHWHGIEPGKASPMTGSVPCDHRHKSVEAARVCGEKLRWEYTKTLCSEVEKVYGPDDLDTLDMGTMCRKLAVTRFRYKHSRTPTTGIKLCVDHAEAYRTHFSLRYEEVGL